MRDSGIKRSINLEVYPENFITTSISIVRDVVIKFYWKVLIPIPHFYLLKPEKAENPFTDKLLN